MRTKIAVLISVIVFSCFSGKTQNKSFTSLLPIVYLNTNGQVIPDEPKITAQLEIAWKGNGQSNSTSDPRDHFSGSIGIELRGSTSQSFPKKAYGFELRNNDGEGVDFPLLGLPEEEDWILYAPYSDKSLMRNVLTFTLANQMSDTYASRCRFVELFLNNEYAGVYVLMEKIKRDKNRVNIAKLKEDDILGEDLTGGYIIKIDKLTGSGGDGWLSVFTNSRGSNTYYQYEYPKYDEIQPVQKEYIHNYVDDFEQALYYQRHGENDGYQNYINPETFYDYVILNELSKNIDGYRLSTFLNKDKNGKLNAGPIWDYNLAFGNADYYDGWQTSEIVIEQDYGEVPFWWRKLLSDSVFTNPMRCRWEELRETALVKENIFGIIDSLTTYLGGAVDRNFERWPVLSQKLWPNYYVGNTYANEINWLKDWIGSRLTQLDLILPGTCVKSGIGDITDNGVTLSFYPNPFQSKLFLKIISDASLEYELNIFNSGGSLLRNMKLQVEVGSNSIDLSMPELQKGIYFYRVTQNGTELSSGKLIKL
ncbi:MAG: CotH kinase family protein [Draconibacterium sp.]